MCNQLIFKKIFDVFFGRRHVCTGGKPLAPIFMQTISTANQNLREVQETPSERLDWVLEGLLQLQEA